MSLERIGKYRVLGVLGRGAMGEVYLAEDPHIGRRVAIKRILGADAELRDRFLREARIVGGLSHPHIVTLLDFDFTGDEPYLVMEYLSGRSLDAWSAEPHSLGEQLRVISDLASALAHAHAHGVIHRDVKPTNVQVLPDGHAKLMDFGIARADSARLTATGAVVGTPNYMPPEILYGLEYSPRSDLYSLAVVAYEMLTGANPFATGTVAGSLHRVLSVEPPPLSELRPDVPAPLAQFLTACLKKDPALRPEGCGALHDLLTSAGSGVAPPNRAGAGETQNLATTDTPLAALLSDVSSSPPPSPPAFATRRGLRGWVRGAALAAALGIGSLAAWRGSFAPEKQAELPAPLTTAPPATVPRAVFESAPSTTPPTSMTVRAEPRRASSQISTPFAARRTEAPPPSPVPTAVATVFVSPPEIVALATLVTPSVAPRPRPRSPALEGASPRTVRRGVPQDVDISGTALSAEAIVVALRGTRAMSGIRVLKQSLEGGGLRVRLLVDEDAPLGSFHLVVRSPSGETSNGVMLEVVL